MKTIYDVTLTDILPPNLRDEQFLAIAAALDDLLKKFSADTKLAMHLPRLDELSGTILNLLAEQFHVDNFDAANLDDDQKKNFIRQSIAHHRRKGTAAAVEEVVNQFFQNAVVDELDGFYFAIKTNAYQARPKAFPTFLRMLDDAKNVRSWLKGIDIDLSPPPSKIYVGNSLAARGVIDFNLKRPSDSSGKIFSGGAMLAVGQVDCDILKPRDSSMTVKVGSPIVLVGDVFIDSRDQPVLNIRENPTVDLAINDVAIVRGDNLVIPPEYDFIKLFFKFPTGGIRRVVTLQRPRPDLTRQEIKDVTDYAVEHNLILYGNQGALSEAPKASLTATKITKLIGE